MDNVVSLERQRCAGGILPVHDAEGYLPSFQSQGDMNVVERFGCTVELIAKRGQIWNLTLLDFGQPDTVTSPREDVLIGNRESTWCTRYADIRETDAKAQTICGPSTQREKNIYLSSSSIIKIDLNLNIEHTSYLIAFRAVGCILPDSPNIVRVSRDGDIHSFHCNTTGEKWTMQCQGSQWQGDHKPCGADPTSSEFRTRNRDWNSTTGLLIVIALGLLLGVIIGTTLLGLVICYYKRRYRQPPPVQQVYTGPTYGSGHHKESTPPLYKTYGKSPERMPTGTAASIEYGRRHASATDMYKYPYQSCQSGGQFHAICLPDINVQNRAHAQFPEEDVTSPHVNTTGPSPIPYKTASDSSSSSDHVYEIPS